MILNENTPPIKILIRFLFLSLSYAILRYHILGGVSWDQLPLYVMNKVFALMVVLLLVYSVWYAKVLTAEQKEWYTWAIAAFVSVHVLISISILSPEYYPKFFDAGKMHFKNELSILFGIATFIAFLGSLLASLKGNIVQTGRFQKVILFLLAAHLLSMGFSSWIVPFKWYGAMPPISLVSFLAVIAIVMLKRRVN